MRIQVLKSYSPRLDVDIKLLSPHTVAEPRSEILVWCNPNNLPKGQVNLFIRIATHVMTIPDEKELIGYIYEHSGTFMPDNKSKDFDELFRFSSEAYLNHRYHFETNAPKTVSSQVLISKPDEEFCANTLMEMLIQEGFYN